MSCDLFVSKLEAKLLLGQFVGNRSGNASSIEEPGVQEGCESFRGASEVQGLASWAFSGHHTLSHITRISHFVVQRFSVKFRMSLSCARLVQAEYRAFCITWYALTIGIRSNDTGMLVIVHVARAHSHSTVWYKEGRLGGNVRTSILLNSPRAASKRYRM